MFFCSFVFLCVTSSVNFTGFYTEDEPNFLSISLLITDTGIVLRVRPLTDSVRGPGKMAVAFRGTNVDCHLEDTILRFPSHLIVVERQSAYLNASTKERRHRNQI